VATVWQQFGKSFGEPFAQRPLRQACDGNDNRKDMPVRTVNMTRLPRWRSHDRKRLTLAASALSTIAATVAGLAGTSASATAAEAYAASASSSTTYSDAEVNKSLDSMARLFAAAVTDEDLRRQIHDGAAKRFDGDTNVLYSTLSNTSDVRAALTAVYSQRQRVQLNDALSAINRMASDIPRFQVAVPAKFDAWNPAGFTPLVAYMPEGVEDTELETITAYDAKGRAHELDAQVAPARPVIVLGVNERTDDSGMLLESKSTATDSDGPGMAGSYLVEINAAVIDKDHEPWAKGAAEVSYRAKSRGCGSVDHTDYDVNGLEHDPDMRQWLEDGGLDLGGTSCPVIMYWWEDDSGSFDFTLEYRGVSLGVHMADGDDLIGGHEHGAGYFKGDSDRWYYGLDDVHYEME
jgi:Protein of unknown function (DUF3103)